jgi:hypothetical protein
MGVSVSNRCLTETYPGADRELALGVVQGFYRKFELPEGTSLSVCRMALSRAKFMAIQRLEDGLPALVEAATVYLMDEAERTGWYHDLEYDNLQELFAGMADAAEEGTGAWYDYHNIVKNILPAARKAEIDPHDLLLGSTQVRKLRGSVTLFNTLTEMMRNERITTTEGEETLREIVKDVADTSLSYPEMKEKWDTWRGKKIERPEPLPGFWIYLPGGGAWGIVITQGKSKEMAVVENGLRNLVNFKLTGLDFLINTVRGFFKKKEDLNEPDSENIS